ncbi:MAG: 5-formyltetrahydrofolate cyclo-ligase [Bacteriovoracaceae bacterium]|nr:5-formyltetrahydrofolate cyclo-ligase [Bacteriovoracaceae bacterium]
MSATKGETRKLIKTAMSKIGDELKREMDRNISSRLLGFLSDLRQNNAFHENSVLGVFSPLGDEPNWTSEFEKSEFHLAFPAWVANGEMVFRPATLDSLKPKNNFGVSLSEPSEELEPIGPDVFIVPGISFTESGSRLGRGKGYYDRYLEGRCGIKIGICFEFQISDQLITEDHDIEMDYVITEKRIICCSKSE